jgi:hypothetical protein
MNNEKNFIFKFNEFKLYEDGECGTCAGTGSGDANATLGNGSGMGAIVAPIPSSIPGDVAGSTKGSGDLPAYDLGNKFGILKNKRKKSKKHKQTVKSFSNWMNTSL